jgi:hypothetical protein
MIQCLLQQQTIYRKMLQITDLQTFINNEDESLLGYSNMQSWSRPMFQRCILSPSPWLMVAVHTSEMLVYSNETTQRHISKGSHLHTHRHENLKSNTSQYCCTAAKPSKCQSVKSKLNNEHPKSVTNMDKILSPIHNKRIQIPWFTYTCFMHHRRMC